MSKAPTNATAVAIGGDAVLIEGPSGSGKSDLALRLIDEGALLIGDDEVWLTPDGDQLIVTPVATIAGRMEVRGLGIIAVPSTAQAPVRLSILLTDDVPRLPETDRGLPLIEIEGVAIPQMKLNGLDASAPAKVRLALMALARDLFRPDIDPQP